GSVAVEEHFYLMLPLVLLLLVRKGFGARDPFRAIPYIVGVAIAACLTLRVMNFLFRSEYSYETYVFPTHLRIDSLLFGVGMAYFHHFHGESFQRTFHRHRHVLMLIGISLMTTKFLMAHGSFYANTFGFMQYYLGGAALLVGVLMCEIPRNRLTAAVASIGAYSYSIYLWHMALRYWVIPKMHDHGI